MQKIMFNDKYNLTQAVLDGRKTQTRRVITYPKTFHGKDVCGYYVCRRATDRAITEVCMYDEDEMSIDEGQILPKYDIGEVVAVAQSYEKSWLENASIYHNPYFLKGLPGWRNKMYVQAALMPHRIRVTDVRIEHLRDISEKDAIAEGITYAGLTHEDYGEPMFVIDGCKQTFGSARDAYAWLIDKMSGKGTWQSNPYVFVYDFELIK